MTISSIKKKGGNEFVEITVFPSFMDKIGSLFKRGLTLKIPNKLFIEKVKEAIKNYSP